jgi:predicted secreted acid phosphatase
MSLLLGTELAGWILLTCKRYSFRQGLKFCFLLAAVALVSGCATCEPQPNLGLYKEKLTTWHDSGSYARCFSAAARSGSEALRKAIAQRKRGTKIAIVLDIDETSLSNWGYLTSVGFDVRTETFFKWVRKHDDPALPPTLAIYRQARKAGISVFFITGRREFLREYTVRQLRAAGYEGWAGLFLCPVDYNEDSIVPFKSGVRKQLTEEGWWIVLNMGDQLSDLEGGFASHPVKLPNPYYFIR